MRRSVLDFALPPERIATHPPAERDGGRLLVVDPGAAALDHRTVRDLPDLLPPGALLVVNDTRVVPARLLGEKAATGGKVELLLVERLEGEGRRERWSAMGRASKPLRPGAVLRFGAGLQATVSGGDEAAPGGRVIEVVLEAPEGSTVEALVDAVGHVPLPPYLGRPDELGDRERYQTVFAERRGAIAAPTAGLHLSHALLERLAAQGVRTASITLHVGLGTFEPVTVDDLDDHPMHAERFSVPDAACSAIRRARSEGNPVVAVGTTVVRALESAASPDGVLEPTEGETRLLIQPGYRFRVVDRLLTNFHLPGSTLLALVGAFAGTERVLAAYRAAVEARYNFYSYGDAMLLQGRAS